MVHSRRHCGTVGIKFCDNPLDRWHSDGESACNAGDVRDMGSVPGLGRSPGGGNSNSLQYSCLENSTSRGAWWAIVHEITKSQNDWAHTGSVTCLHGYWTHTHVCVCVCVLSHFSRVDSLWPSGPSPTRLLCPWDSPGKNTGVGCHTLLQGIFQVLGLNLRSLKSPELVGMYFTSSSTWKSRTHNSSRSVSHLSTAMKGVCRCS